MNRPFIIAVISLTALTWFAMTISVGLPNSYSSAAYPFWVAITVAGGFSFLYQKYMWHWHLFQCLISKTPDLRGVWKVTIRPAWIDPNTGLQKNPVEGYAQIDQTTATSLCVRIFTHDSRSQSIAFSIDETDSEFRLVAIYENKPQMQNCPREGTSHLGSAIYRFREYRPREMTGEYWTDTTNLGEILLHDRKCHKGITSFKQGQSVFEST